VQATFRGALENATLGGTEIEAGTNCFVILAAANRDPAQFALLDKFDIAPSRGITSRSARASTSVSALRLRGSKGAIAIGELLRRFFHISVSGRY
jgi:hypothetical protein